MHPYTTDSDERQKVPAFLAFAAVLAAFVLPKILLKLDWAVPWWLDAPSTMGFYGLFHTAFDRYMWRWSWIRSLGLVKVPILDSIWEGELSSDYSPGSPVKMKATIRQRWTKLSVFCEFPESRSESTTASLLVEGPAGPALLYQYRNAPVVTAVDTMAMHEGTVRLYLLNGELEGDYYAGRNRKTIGGIKLKKVSS